MNPVADGLVIPVVVAALGCGLMAGLFFAFSNFVMRALDRLAAEHKLAAMQSINVVVLNPLFLALFLGSGVLCLLLAAAALWRWPAPGSGWLLAGSLCYVIGNVLVTMAGNVPLNNTLARADAAGADAAWRAFYEPWMRWNHVRTITAFAAMTCFMVALAPSR